VFRQSVSNELLQRERGDGEQGKDWSKRKSDVRGLMSESTEWKRVHEPRQAQLCHDVPAL
jgi:hypothetical protein